MNTSDYILYSRPDPAPVDYAQLNAQLSEQLAPEHQRRLLAYALDTDYLSDEAHRGFPAYVNGHDNLVAALTQLGWFVRLYWVRAFFEHGDGNNIWQCLRDKFPTAQEVLTHYRLRHLAQDLPVPFSDRTSFLRESWLVGGGENPDAGESSEIWQFLTPLVRELPPAADDQAIIDIAQGRIEKAPAFFKELIQTKDHTFVATLRALRTGNGQGWLGRVKSLYSYRANKPSASAKWMLCLNGNDVRLDLVIDDIFVPEGQQRTLMVRQGSAHSLEVRHSAGTRREFIRLADLREAHFSGAEKVSVRIGQSSVAEVDALDDIVTGRPMMFRFHRDGDPLPMVQDDHVYARRLAIVWPCSILVGQQLQCGDQTIRGRRVGNLRVREQETGRVVEIFEFNDLANTASQRLMWNGETLLHVGTQPYIEVANAATGVRCLEHERAFVVLDEQTRLTLHNVPQGQDVPAWNCQEGGTVAENGGRVTLTPTAFGTPVTVRCGESRESVIFLPKCAMGGAALGWGYSPDTDNASRFARDGLQAGTLQHGETRLSLTHPIDQVVWWWEQGVLGGGGGVNRLTEFNNYGEMQSYRLCLWVPANKNAGVLFNNVELARFSGPECHSVLITPLLQNRLQFGNALGDVIDTIHVNNDCAAEVLRVPNRPALTMRNGQPHVFFPQPATGVAFQPSEYSVVCCYESGLVSDKVEVVPCQDSFPGQLTPLRLQHTQQNGEGVWLLLVHERADVLPQSLIAFALGHHHVECALEWHAQTSRPLRQRLAVDITDDQVSHVRGRLDVLAGTANILRGNRLLLEAIRDRELLKYNHLRAFWDSYFSEYCQLEAGQTTPCPRGRRRRDAEIVLTHPSPLEEALGLMLRAGFNWCAEPDWLTWAYGQIPLAMGWKKVGKKCKKMLREVLGDVCPPMLAQRAIEAGFPCCDQNEFPCPSLNHDVLQPDGALCLRCLDTANDLFSRGVCLTRVIRDGIKVQEIREERAVTFRYHGANEIQTPHDRCPFIIYVPSGGEESILDYALDEMEQDSNPTPILGRPDRDNLAKLFVETITAAHLALGDGSTRGLGYVFSLTSDAFMQWASDDQPNRATIFQAAAMSRLHAWLGWARASYPQNWPLLQLQNYGLVCGVVAGAWSRPACRKMLMKDLVPVEWMLAWFHR